MHHYPFHPGDYLLDTAHLEPMHDLCYRRMLDLYYVSEQALPDDKQLLSKRLRVDQQLLEEILTEFFTLTQKGWEQDKCERVLAKYQNTSEARKKAGSLGGSIKTKQKRSKTKQLLSNSQANASNQEPVTKNQEPVFPQDYPAGHVAALSKWWSYKKEKRESYKETGWSTLLNQQLNFTADQVERSVETSISSNYSGLFTDKIQKADNHSPGLGWQKKEGGAVFVEAPAVQGTDAPEGWEAAMDEVWGEGWQDIYACWKLVPHLDQAKVRAVLAKKEGGAEQ